MGKETEWKVFFTLSKQNMEVASALKTSALQEPKCIAKQYFTTFFQKYYDSWDKAFVLLTQHMVLTKKQMEAEHRKIMAEVLQEKEKVKNNRTKISSVTGIILVLLLILWLMPSYNIPKHPRPNNIPSLEKVLTFNLTIPERQENKDIYSYIENNNPKLKIIANRIVTDACKTPDKRCAAESLYLFVKDNIKYVSDPIDEYYETPAETLLGGSADCDGMSILLASLLQTSGIKTRFKFIPNHVYVQARVPKRSWFAKNYEYEWIDLDPTCKQCKAGETPLDAMIRS